MVFAELGVPLLIVNGNFQNLDKMTVEELETFIPFMAQCSVNRGGATLVNGAPEWWVKTIPFKFPLKKPKGLSEIGYRRHLQSMVCRCYCYHDAHFLLSFCSKICKEPHSIFLRDNEDNTTSVFLVENAAHILTFDNENKEYDNKGKEKPNWRSLLPTQSIKSNFHIVPDIYLCENCDGEFYSQADMQRHERECYGTALDDLSDDIQIITHIKPPPVSPHEQNGFLSYFDLYSKSSQIQRLEPEPEPEPSPAEQAPIKRWVILNMCLHKNRKIEFSSLLGRKMLEHRVKRDIMIKVNKSIRSNELCCGTGTRPPREVMKPMLRPRLTFRKPKKTEWTHFYCFNKRQRIQKLKTLQTGLDEESRKSLKTCRECCVSVEQMIIPKADYYVVSSDGHSFFPLMINSIEEDLYECGVLNW